MKSISGRISSQAQLSAGLCDTVLQSEDGLLGLSYPDGRLSSVRLLQAEDLCHHVVSGGMQQDSAGGQADHDVAAHGRQANRDSIGTWCRRNNKNVL